MRLIVSSSVQEQVRQIAINLQRKNGIASRRKFIEKFRHLQTLLRQHPRIGQIEPCLTDEPEVYRCIVMTPLNKLIYTIHEDNIEIVDMWDTRRDPTSLVEELKKQL